MDDRSWMYNKNLPGRSGLTDEFYRGVTQFMEFALSHASGSQIRCPCRECKNEKYQIPETVRKHLYRKGFIQNYLRWICHGEPPYVQSDTNLNSSSHVSQTFPMREEYDHLNPQQRMIFDAAGPHFIPYWAENITLNSDHPEDASASSNPDFASSNIREEMNTNLDDDIGLSGKFWDVLKAAEQPLWSGCESETQLSSVSELLGIKSEFNLSENCYNKICEWAGRCMPRDHTFPSNYYETKKLVRDLGLPMERIDICPEGCMLYWKDDASRQCCKFCNRERYKRMAGTRGVPHKQLRYLPIIPRLQRLFALPTTAKAMRWHAEHETEEGTMCHPSDGEVWKDFDQTHPEFANEPGNVRLALCGDGFTPFGQSAKAYSCWPIILTPYNLPPSMCLKTPRMLLSMVIPGPHNPEKLIDVCLQPLIQELKLLWTQGVPTFDISRGKTFCMRAALLWTINDFPAYGMMSGWSTAGLMACPICMNDRKTFWLEGSKKPTWFDCHRRFLPHDHPFRKDKKAFLKDRVETSSAPERLKGEGIWHWVKDMPTMMEDPFAKISGYGKEHKWTKQSIFWQLPYWKTLLLPHNLDVMHTEKNVFDNVFNTVMDIKGKSKDSVKARIDLKLYCDRPQLEVDKDHHGPIPKALYTLTKTQKAEICNWVKSLKFPDGYVSNIGQCVQLDECKLVGMKSHDCHVFMQRLIPIAFREMLPESVWGPLTELSQFFHSLCSPTLSVAEMQELDTAIPVLLCKLERIFPPSFVDSMEHLLIHLPYEAKIGGPVQYRWMYPFERFLHHLKKKVGNKARVEASICSSYIIEEISTLAKQYCEPRMLSGRKRSKDNEGSLEDNSSKYSIFNYPGRAFGKSAIRWLTNDPREKYAIETCVLLNCAEVEPYLKIFSDEVGGANDTSLDNNFTSWFKAYVKENKIEDELIQSLARGPRADITTFSAYIINGYTFHTLQREEGKPTMNSGVMVKSSNYQGDEADFYGQLEEIIQLKYSGVPSKQVVLFKCRWFNPTTGTQSHKKYDLVDVHSKKFYRTTDPFILAEQAIQVYYTNYPGATRDRKNWWAVCKTKARSTIEEKWLDIEEPYQPEEAVRVPTIDGITLENFRDLSGAMVDGNEELENDLEAEEIDHGVDTCSSSDDEIVYGEEESNDIASDDDDDI